jgi:hypothetical protein
MFSGVRHALKQQPYIDPADEDRLRMAGGFEIDRGLEFPQTPAKEGNVEDHPCFRHGFERMQALFKRNLFTQDPMTQIRGLQTLPFGVENGMRHARVECSLDQPTKLTSAVKLVVGHAQKKIRQREIRRWIQALQGMSSAYLRLEAGLCAAFRT